MNAKATTGRNGSAADIVEDMDRKLSPLTDALIDATLAVFAVPMPVGYPNEREWRRGQYAALVKLLREEKASPAPSVARFRRRARVYIKHMERLSKRPAEENKLNATANHEAKSFVSQEAGRLESMNYAEALQDESYELAKVKLTREAERTWSTDLLPGWLQRLDVINAERMAEAHEWVQKPSNLPPLTRAHVSDQTVHQLATNLAAEAKGELS